MANKQGVQASLNYLSGNRAVLEIPQLTNTSFTANGFMIPDMMIPPATQETPFVVMPHAGEKITYSELVINFNVTENLENWIELHDWIRSLGFPNEFNEYKLRKFERLDGYVVIYNSSNNPIIRFKFINLVPSSLQGFSMTEDIQETTVVTSAIAMSYERFDIEFVGQ